MPKYGMEIGPFRFDFSLSRSSKKQVLFEKTNQSWKSLGCESISYDSDKILKKAIVSARKVKNGEAIFERDTVTFDEHEYVHQMLSWMMQTLLKDNRLSVFDFGGGFGSRYFQHKDIFDKFDNIVWCVLEQDNFVSIGRAEFSTENLKFAETIDEANDLFEPNFLLLSSVLQYLEKPYDVLENLLEKKIPNILIDRTMARYKMKDELFIQHVPPSIYEASYPVWFLDADKIESQLTKYGYRKVENIDPHPGSSFGPKENSWPYLSWYFVLK